MRRNYPANGAAKPVWSIDVTRSGSPERRMAPWLQRLDIRDAGSDTLIEVAKATKAYEAFTLAELLVSVFVLVIITLIVAQLMTSATAVTRTGHKQIETDTQARVVFDRMALDLAQMLKRMDVDYYLKQKAAYNGHGNGHGCGRGRNGDKGSDQIAFFSQVPGYYPSGVVQQSSISLVAYRVNEGNANNNPAYGRLERMAKGLIWNAFDNNPNSNSPFPIVFAPGQIAAGTGPWVGPWSAAISNDNGAGSRDLDYEVIGPGVFRFEYYYVDFPDQLTIYNPVQLGLSQVEAIAVSIAVIDPAGRALIQAASANAGYGDILDVAAELPDFKNSCGRGPGGRTLGDLEDQWKGVVESIAQTGRTPFGLAIPPEAAKQIRIYSRYFDLKTF
jgi:competence protein ComGC